MSNNWKYSFLTQKQRASMIRDGNRDVYNAEKANNSMLRKERNELGLSTADIDKWDNYIDAMNKQAENKRTVITVPSTMAEEKQNLLENTNASIDSIQKEYARMGEKAIEKAADDADYLKEWLANNGFSEKGITTKRENEKLTKELEDTLVELKAEYEEKVRNKMNSFISALITLGKKAN